MDVADFVPKYVCIFYELGRDYRTLVGKPEGKRPLGRPRRRWVDNIRVDLTETEWDVMD
jgi:hypothetical protein